ncbi:histidine kinase dimerization/phospho-acceptor domain-containing protein [Rhodanobacter sp. L36]|uniref:histidine kinase dimerization/phospho-acceptor domain-containing protein n=1 Tax=Rhodanobacter sp. L36 TaxID=1747221 RepID=UPI00131C0BAB|nr:histidine kinase dimerization/phospho-acceptor domain-containing protein [Rhodanobacter sp. L36]
MSIRLRITLFLVGAIVLTLGSATWLLDAHIDNEVAAQADTNLLERAQALSDIFRMGPIATQSALGTGRMPQFLADDGIVYFNIRCGDEHVLSSPAAADLHWPTMSAGKPVFADMSDAKGSELRGVSLSFPPSSLTGSGKGTSSASSCHLGLAVDLKEVRSFQTSMDRIEYGCVLIAVLIVALLAPLLIRRGLKPLTRLAEAVQLIGPESPERRLDTDSSSELKPLIMRFNEVLSRMEEGLMRERQFASGVAHELRTPLAEMHTMIEVELRYPSHADLRAFLAVIGNIGMEMERLVTALLLLTRIEAGIERVQYQSIDIGALTRKLLERLGEDIHRRHLDVTLGTRQALIWQADPTLLEVVLGNLLGNAVAYAPVGSRLRVSYQSNSWTLQNDAPGLDEDDVLLMHRRFWRKGQDAGVHTGLGVALATAAAGIQSMHLSLKLMSGQLHAVVRTDRPASLSVTDSSSGTGASSPRALASECLSR